MSIFLTLYTPFHIELLDKFVHVTPWEFREQSARWVTLGFFFGVRFLSYENYHWTHYIVDTCPNTYPNPDGNICDHHLSIGQSISVPLYGNWSPILIMQRPRKLLRNIVFLWLSSFCSFSVFVGTNFPKAKDFYGRYL